MFNPQRVETIRANIQNSTLLSDHEKSDWLNLLELMNDKQLGELEEILAAEAPAVKPSVSASAPAMNSVKPATPQAVQPTQAPQTQKMPPLSHIANIPSDVTMTHSVPAPLSSQSAGISQPINTAPANYAPEPSRPEGAQGYKPAFTLEDPEQLQTISVDTIRNFDLQSVVNVIRDAIIEEGYFHILQLVEESPLYKSYLESGQSLLNNKQATMSQAEFEFVTDLLRHMRFNTK